jgi:hypothetical protein
MRNQLLNYKGFIYIYNSALTFNAGDWAGGWAGGWERGTCAARANP